MKLIAFIFLFCSIIFPYPQAECHAASFYYARVEEENVGFYSSKRDASPLFYMEQSYFVQIYGDEDLYYKAKFKDIDGYVKKEEVKVVEGTPKLSYPQPSMSVYALDGLGLYKSPTLKSSALIETVPYLNTNLTYYGKIEGENVPGKTTLWYYCKFSSLTSSQEGYLYSLFCDCDTIAPNTEVLNYLTTPPIFSPQGQDGSGLSATAKTFIILSVSLPCAYVLYLLIKPTREALKTKARRPRHRRRDYFEFDENDL